MNHVILPKSLKKIADRSFEYTFCSIILYDTIEEIGHLAFNCCTVYTDIDFKDINKKEKLCDSIFYSSQIFNCKIVNGYVEQIIYKKELVDEESIFNYESSINLSNYDNFGCIIPYREGYFFKGWSYTEDGKVINYQTRKISIKNEISDLDSFVIQKDVYVFFNIDELNELKNETILYAIWEKIDEN